MPPRKLDWCDMSHINEVKEKDFLNQLKVQRTMQLVINDKVIFQDLSKGANSFKHAQDLHAGKRHIFSLCIKSII